MNGSKTGLNEYLHVFFHPYKSGFLGPTESGTCPQLTPTLKPIEVLEPGLRDGNGVNPTRAKDLNFHKRERTLRLKRKVCHKPKD